MQTSTRAGCIYWMAPELIDPERFGLMGKFVRTPASDVYAFGCVCFELYTGRPPFARLPEPTALLKVVNGERAKRSQAFELTFSDDLWDCITSYWAENPASRPPIQDVVQEMAWPPTDAPFPRERAIIPPAPSPPISPTASSFTFPPNADPELELNADVLRALQDCRAGLSNATRLTKALQLSSHHVPRALHAVRCLAKLTLDTRLSGCLATRQVYCLARANLDASTMGSQPCPAKHARNGARAASTFGRHQRPSSGCASAL
ncbi:kinase-like domain-containing protein [Mycena amicta]|nr:kinase-like domain-containing protein [Mycena amicta]